jgi:chemotaxis protein methyltransferase CheR
MTVMAMTPGDTTPLRAISDADFALFRTLIYRDAGIHLSEAKKALLVGRLASRLRDLGVTSFRAYFKRVESDEAERHLMLERICTHETHFFREPQHFALLEQVLLPLVANDAAAGRRSRRVRVWSAGCSSGQEPYSLAMLLLAHLPPEDGWSHEILATDLSKRILERAEGGLWPIELAREIPERYLKRFMLRGHGSSESLMKAGPELRSIVHFQQCNLHEGSGWPKGEFDFIFCRNVLIYFDPRSKADAIDRLLDRLAPSGYFFVGHAESLNGLTGRVRSRMPTVYQLAGES